jgi:hypothetical protein
MKTKFVVPLGVVSLVVLFAGWQLRPTAASAASDPAPAVATAVTATVTAQAGDAEFVGSNKCKKCHLAVNKSWEKTRHGNAFNTLKAGQASEAKTKYGLDPAKDYTTDATCVECHVVGFGKKGGFTMGADEKANKDVINVGCENCHGPGGAYLEHHEKVMKEKLTYTHDEMHAAGLAKISAETCTKCHNDKSPTMKGKTFNYEESLKTGIHDHEELKQLKK